MLENHNVFIKMLIVQHEDGETTQSELMTQGIMKCFGELISVAYIDTQATGFEGNQTIVMARGSESVSILRRGTASSTLILETGKKHHCYYSTPFGSTNIGISTEKIENCLDEKGGTLYLKYTIDMNASLVSDNEIKLVVSVID